MYRGYEALLVEQQDKIVVTKFNNPKKKNSLSRVAYKEITRILEDVNKDDTVTIVVFTGVGDYFTSGNDLSQAGDIEDLESYVKEANLVFKRMIAAFINCTKIIISLVNGPSIGIGATIVGLSDIAWCVEHAYFLTPFTRLGLVPEGCSSYLMPRAIGRSKASEMLLFNEPMTSQEAYQFNYVSRVYKPTDLDTVIWPKIREMAKVPPGSLLTSKKLMRLHENEALERANQAETEELYKRFFTDEFVEAMMSFAMRKNKSKL